MSVKKDDIHTNKPKSIINGKPKAKRGPGRPKAEIDWEKVDAFLKAGCTGTEVASHLGIHEDTLYLACQKAHNMGFSAYSQQKKSAGVALLKYKQFDKAMKGDSGMLVWLGKNWLGQRDKPQEEQSEQSNIIEFKITEELIERNNGQDENNETETTAAVDNQLQGSSDK